MKHNQSQQTGSNINNTPRNKDKTLNRNDTSTAGGVANKGKDKWNSSINDIGKNKQGGFSGGTQAPLPKDKRTRE